KPKGPRSSGSLYSAPPRPMRPPTTPTTAPAIAAPSNRTRESAVRGSTGDMAHGPNARADNSSENSHRRRAPNAFVHYQHRKHPRPAASAPRRGGGSRAPSWWGVVAEPVAARSPVQSLHNTPALHSPPRGPNPPPPSPITHHH